MRIACSSSFVGAEAEISIATIGRSPGRHSIVGAELVETDGCVAPAGGAVSKRTTTSCSSAWSEPSRWTPRPRVTVYNVAGSSRSGTNTNVRPCCSKRPLTAGSIEKCEAASTVPSWSKVNSMPVVTGTSVAWLYGRVVTTRSGDCAWNAHEPEIVPSGARSVKR